MLLLWIELLSASRALAEAAPTPPPRRRPGRGQTSPESPETLPAPPNDPELKLQGIVERRRWRLVEEIGVEQRWWDPYHQNTIKGDRPLAGEWFMNLGLLSSSVALAGSEQRLREELAVTAGLLKGDTAFKPPDLRLQVAALVAPFAPGTPAGLRTGYLDGRLWIASARYDFDALRIGLQPITTDFRGFLFRDEQPGIRLYGNRFNNRFQYTLAAFQRIPWRTDAPVPDLAALETPDPERVYTAVAYVQDVGVTGLNLNLSGTWQRPREDEERRSLGLGMEGHIGRLNLTVVSYLQETAEGLVAAEPSIDFDWLRVRGSLLVSSAGYAPLRAQPTFAGSLSSAWVQLQRPGKAPRSFTVEGDGLQLFGGGVSAALLPTLRASADVNLLRLTTGGGLGADLSAGIRWRPLFNDILAIRLGGGLLSGGPGLTALGSPSSELVTAQLQLLVQY